MEFICSRKWESNGEGIDCVTNDVLTDYRSYATNRTEWQQIYDRWGPIKTRVISDISDRKNDHEIRYMDRTFRDDLDEKLSDASELTTEIIPMMISSDEFSKRFEKL